MSISGKEIYTLGKPIYFFLTVDGYGSGCGDSKAIFTKVNDPQYKSLGYMSSSSCVTTMLKNFKFDLPAVQSNINQTGDYVITASFKDSVTNQSIIVDKKFSIILGDRNQTIISPNMSTAIPQDVIMPLKQVEEGIQPQNVRCDWSGFQLILKSKDGSPACVYPYTAQTLSERGWGHFPLRLR